MKKLLLACCFASISSLTFAQNSGGAFQNDITFGIMGGSNVAFLQVKLPSGTTVSNNPVYPGSFGVNADFKVSDYLSVRPGIFYTGKGGDVQYIESFITPGIGSIDGDIDQQFKLYYLEIPVTLIGHIPVSDSFNILVGAGPYIALYMNGKITTTNGNSAPDTENAKSGKNGDFKSTDFGASALLGVETSSGIIIDLNYDIGLTNIIETPNASSPIQQLKTGSIYLSLGFAFK
jgi:hypothetical protein